MLTQSMCFLSGIPIVDSNIEAQDLTPTFKPGGGGFCQDQPIKTAGSPCGFPSTATKKGFSHKPITSQDAHNIADMKYSVSPVVKVAVKAKDGKDLPK